MSLYGIAAAPLLIWVYLLLGRGGFWRVPASGTQVLPAAPARDVVVLIPARNEAATIAASVASLARQTFDGRIHLIVIDDGSSDQTAERAQAAAREAGVLPRFTLLRGAAQLPAGWSGKLWALSQGVEAAAGLPADYFLLTDADILHSPTSVASLVAEAVAHDRDLVSHMVRLSVARCAEQLLIPAFVYFFFKLYPPAWVADPRRAVAAAAGGCLLIRPAALARAGGFAAIRSQIIDDCALARAVKTSGGHLCLELAADTCSLRRYGSALEIGAMISRTAFAQLRHSYPLLLATLCGLFLTYLLPLALALSSDVWLRCLGVGALLLMSVSYFPVVRFYGLSPLWCLCLPLIAAFYMAAVIHSAVQYARGRGGRWKGRVQDAM